MKEMAHAAVWLSAIAAVGIAAWSLEGFAEKDVPALTVLSPSGGEMWRTGETHIISWNTRKVPSADKVSVAIRRIPPPPLPEEGQEFDPIVFVGLENTGSTTWKISPMYRDGAYVLEVGAYRSVPITDMVSGESGIFNIAHPPLSSVLSPLYAGADWNGTETEEVAIGQSSYSGTSIESAPLDAGMDPGAVIAPFEAYYAKRLASLGWRVANDLAAGGHMGGQTGYRRGGAIILVRFGIGYAQHPANAPSECPCTVTLSLFSSDI